MIEDSQDWKEEDAQPERVGGETGNKTENVKSVERNKKGKIIAQPGDVRYVRDEVAPADEEAREAGEV